MSLSRRNIGGCGGGGLRGVCDVFQTSGGFVHEEDSDHGVAVGTHGL